MRYKQKKVNGSHVDEHRLVMEASIGRKLATDEHVHHINGNKLDNRIENLEILDPVTHGRHHHLRYPLTKCCEVCGAEFTPHKTKRKRQKTCGESCRQVLSARNRYKLTKEQMQDVVRRRSEGEKLAVLAVEFGVTQTTICDIAKGRVGFAYDLK